MEITTHLGEKLIKYGWKLRCDLFSMGHNVIEHTTQVHVVGLSKHVIIKDNYSLFFLDSHLGVRNQYCQNQVVVPHI